MTRPTDEIDAYLDGEPTPEQARALQDWIQADKANARAFLAAVRLHQQIGSQLRKDRFDQALRSTDQPATTKDGDAAIQALAELTRLNEEGLQSPVNFTTWREEKANKAAAEHRKVLLTRTLVGGAIAAVMLLGVVLAIVLLGGPDNDQPIVETPVWPDETTPTTLPVVATLTDAVGAQWRSDDKPVQLPMGVQLVAHERLTLTHGFAEITTLRGAKALLQAPCTFELTDHDNAIRLHSGKMVGKCETPSSKGFVVHAPGMDVVDLGTEFGVAADAQSGSTVLVMDGSVRAQPTEQSPRAFEPVVLETSQARRVKAETGSLEMIAVTEAPVFQADLPHPYVASVLEAKPVAYWRFENDTGQIIKSEIQPDRDQLTVIGNAQLTEDGVVGKAALLTNQAEPYAYFETRESIAALGALDEYTIELWYFTNERYEVDKDNSVGTLLSLYDPEQGNQFSDASDAKLLSLELGNDFWVDKPAKWWGVHRPPNWREHAIRCFPLRDLQSAEKQEIYSTKQYLIGRWQHLVFVKSTDGVTLYLDGEPVDQAGYTPRMLGPAAVRLGRSALDVVQETDPDAAKTPLGHGHQRALRGRLDEVALYAKALDPEQIKKHHALATGEALKDLID
ncbi:MAG: hypothetical protein KTR15_11580 [Phycisphaeraceae bacterium]|nr:hypothetical protein [Phycisphaeraceae bacterium]